MKTKNEIQNELDSIAPFLSKLEKREEMKSGVPAGYFEHLSDRVLHQIYELEGMSKKQPQEVSVWERLKNRAMQWFAPRMAVPVFGSLLIIVSIGYYTKNSLSKEKEYFSAISKQEAIQYLESNADEMDENLIANLNPAPADIILSQEQEQVSSYLEENDVFEDLEEI